MVTPAVFDQLPSCEQFCCLRGEQTGFAMYRRLFFVHTIHTIQGYVPNVFVRLILSDLFLLACVCVCVLVINARCFVSVYEYLAVILVTRSVPLLYCVW